MIAGDNLPTATVTAIAGISVGVDLQDVIVSHPTVAAFALALTPRR